MLRRAVVGWEAGVGHRQARRVMVIMMMVMVMMRMATMKRMKKGREGWRAGLSRRQACSVTTAPASAHNRPWPALIIISPLC